MLVAASQGSAVDVARGVAGMNREEYREVYLRSDHWLETRKGALERAGHRCQVCNTEHQLDVHHRTYERIGYEAAMDLTVLCRKCHDLFHGSCSVKSAQKRPRSNAGKRRGKKVKVSCAYCKGKDGRHEHTCKRNEGERSWQEGIRTALEKQELDKTGRVVQGRAAWRI